jgi:hypothetical protein
VPKEKTQDVQVRELPLGLARQAEDPTAEALPLSAADEVRVARTGEANVLGLPRGEEAPLLPCKSTENSSFFLKIHCLLFDTLPRVSLPSTGYRTKATLSVAFAHLTVIAAINHITFPTEIVVNAQANVLYELILRTPMAPEIGVNKITQLMIHKYFIDSMPKGS